jgi:Domain of unknown function (DUF4177)
MKSFVSVFLIVCAFLLGMILTRPVESARRYEYRVVSITAIKELRTQSDADQGRLKTIEKTINDQAAQGWELFQADGYVLYFRR